MQLSGCEVKRIAQSQELKRLLKEKSGKKCLTGKDEGAKLRKSFGRDSRRKISSQFPVTMAKGYHLFPYRTQKLRPSAPMVLGWTRPGRVGRCRNPYKRSSCRNAGAFLLLLFCGFGGEFSENGCFEVALRWMGGEGNHPPPAFGGRSPFLCGGRRGGAWGGWNGWEGRRRGKINAISVMGLLRRKISVIAYKKFHVFRS